MGVPRLFKYICEMCPKAVKNPDFIVNVNGKDVVNKIDTVDNLFIDTNAIIHEMTQKVFNYGQYKRLLYSYSKLTFEEKQNKVYEMTFNKIAQLAEFVVPTKILYIAIDGVAPLGKMAQQRQRRFMAVRSTLPTEVCARTDEVPIEVKFNPNCITPGTSFMNGLRLYFQYRIVKYLDSLHQNANSLKVVYSSADVPGEGEHKILEYLREHPETIKQKNAIFGPDGDLIMLTLGSKVDFLLIRDDQTKINKMHIVDMSHVKKIILDKMGTSPKERTESTSTAINDFILMGFFVGNDFLSKLQMFYLLEDGMDLMFELYSKLKKPLTSGNNIIFENFLELCKLAKQYEKTFLSEQIQLAQKADEKFRNNTLLKCVVEDVNNVFFNYTKYRELYNTKIKDVKKMSHDYILGLDWVFKYYIKGCPNFGWCYEHHYAPLLIDLVENFDCSLKISEDINTPHTQFQQLLAILPSVSKNLLPKELHCFYDNPALKEYYPNTFEIDYEGKYQDYQGIALLPFIDFPKLKKIYNATHFDHPFDKRGYVLYFKRSSATNKYDTKLGIISANVDVRRGPKIK